jgi:hypothetical protein
MRLNLAPFNNTVVEEKNDVNFTLYYEVILFHTMIQDFHHNHVIGKCEIYEATMSKL